MNKRNLVYLSLAVPQLAFAAAPHRGHVMHMRPSDAACEREADARDSTGDVLGAADMLDDCIGYGPSVELERMRVTLLLSHGRYDEALSAARDFAEREPDANEVYAYLSLACEKLGRLDDAFAYAQMLLRREPSSDAALLAIGRIQMKRGDFEGAALALGGVGNGPLRKAAAYGLGVCYVQLHRPEDARDQLRRLDHWGAVEFSRNLKALLAVPSAPFVLDF